MRINWFSFRSILTEAGEPRPLIAVSVSVDFYWWMCPGGRDVTSLSVCQWGFLFMSPPWLWFASEWEKQKDWKSTASWTSQTSGFQSPYFTHRPTPPVYLHLTAQWHHNTNYFKRQAGVAQLHRSLVWRFDKTNDHLLPLLHAAVSTNFNNFCAFLLF